MLTIKELKQQIKISERTIRRFIKDNKITAYKVAGKYLFKQEDIEEFLKQYKI